MIPESLDGWNLPLVQALLAQGVFESDRFDFKERLPDPRDKDGQKRLRSTCAAFANSRGGFLIFGVKDTKGLAPTARLVGIENTVDFPEHFGKFPSACEPSVAWAFKNPPIVIDDALLVHVVHIPQRDRGPHSVPENDRLLFFKRTNKGNEHMSFEELRSAFIEGVRLRGDLGFLLSELERFERKANDVNLAARNPERVLEVSLVRYSSVAFEAALPRVFSEIAHNRYLIERLAAVRTASAEWDRFADRLNEPRTPEELHTFLDTTKRYAIEVSRASQHARQELERQLSGPSAKRGAP